MNCLKKQRGFSLIELMVVVAIMGILASIGIPQYLQYRRDALYAGLEANLSTVERAVLTCMNARGWNQCNSIGPNAVAISNLGNTGFGADSPNICTQFTENVGGSNFEACTQINAITGLTQRTYNKRTCYDQGPIVTTVQSSCSCACTTGFDDANNLAAAVDSGGTCTTKTVAACVVMCGDSATTTPCDDVGGTDVDAYCASKRNAANSRCGAAGMTGVCNAATGLCG